MALSSILDTAFRVTLDASAAYYFAGLLYNTAILPEYYVYRGLKIEKEIRKINFDDNSLPKARIAVMIPAYREGNVIGRTLDFYVQSALEYDANYTKAYVGTYLNDPETRKVVKEKEREYPNLVEEIVNPKPGPTTKAQNVNNIYYNIRKCPYEVIGLHDSEDFIPSNVLRATNYIYQTRVKDDDYYAGIQFAVRAKPDNYSLTNMIYMIMLRFTNLFLTGKNNRGFIPSHGTGIYFKQSILEEIIKKRGYLFDEKDFTEDFEISLYLYYHLNKTLWYSPYPIVWEYFPSDFKRAVRQVSRWQYGALQALSKHAVPIIRKLIRDPSSAIYSSLFGFYGTGMLWIPSFIVSLMAAIHSPINYFSPIEQVVFTINAVNGFRYFIEVPILYEKLLNEGRGNRSLESKVSTISKEVFNTVYGSLLSASANAYAIKRFLLSKRKVWTKTEHK